MKKVYFFDFDGTLTTHDTMFMFLRFCDKEKFAIKFILHIPLFVLLKLKLVKAEKVKRQFIASVLKDKSEKYLLEKSEAFFQENYPSLVRETSLEFIQNIDYSKTECYIVTASLDVWVKPFAQKFKMKLIATEAKFENGVFSGHFKTKNCNGKEKVRRIKQEIGDKSFDKSVAFGDTAGDKEMLNFADEGHFKFFH